MIDFERLETSQKNVYDEVYLESCNSAEYRLQLYYKPTSPEIILCQHLNNVTAMERTARNFTKIVAHVSPFWKSTRNSDEFTSLVKASF